MADLEALRRLAQQHGVELDWYDIWGGRHEVPEATLRAVLGAMHVAARDDAEVHAALHDGHGRAWRRRVPPVLVVRVSVPSVDVVLRSAACCEDVPLRWRLVLEDGMEREGSCIPRELPEVDRTEVNGEPYVARRLGLGPQCVEGYHTLELYESDGTAVATMRLIVVPERCYLPDAVRGSGRVWGPAVQLYALRSRRNWGMGDFADLETLVDQWARGGAGIVGLNPLHALFPHAPERASPYSPSSRLFLNVHYLAPERIADFATCDDAQRLLNSPGYAARLEALRTTECVDYAAVAGAKNELLELLYASFRAEHLARHTSRAAAFRAFQRRGGVALRRHALFEALQEALHRDDPGCWGWPVWPEAYRDPQSPAVSAFEAAQLERVEYREWLQWQAHVQLEALGRRCMELGLGVGLYGDLAVSVDRGGAEVWADQGLYALRVGVGAPPDDFNLQGQDWGLPPPIPDALRERAYAPFVEVLRANMRAVGAVRIDHVMALMRLFWIPQDTRAADGAYVRYPLEDLLGIVALESHRNRCMVIGEDLGTVPDAVRDALAAADVLSYRLLYFERRHDGDFKSPAEYPAAALVAVSTHDLPTLAGFWAAGDLKLRERLHLYPSPEAGAQQALARRQDRARLLAALQRESLLPRNTSSDPASTPAMTPELACAVHLYLARTPSKVLMVQPEDVIGVLDQANVPGTTFEYPNWRRKLPMDLDLWPAQAAFARLCGALSAERSR